MAAKQARYEEMPKEQTFSDMGSLPSNPLLSPPMEPPSELPNEASVERGASDTVPPSETAVPQTPHADPADFFVSCMDVVEQQKFLNFCEARGLTPSAGILLFLKEPLARDQLNPLAANPFVDEAQSVVDSMQPAQGTISPMRPRTGQKPIKPCEVCGTPFVVQFLGRQLCEKPECWHTYAGISPQRPLTRDAQGNADSERRLGRLETMMERVAATLDRLVGA